MDEKLQKNYPVTTLVLYFGTDERWTAPKNLYGCFGIPEELKPFVSDYKINVFEIGWLSDETIEKFTSDFKIVAQYFKAKRLKSDYTGSKEIIRHVDETLKMLSALTGDNSFETVYNETISKKEGGTNMCDVVERIINKGISQGISQGKEDVIRQMLGANLVTPKQIADVLKLPLEEIQRIAEQVPERA